MKIKRRKKKEFEIYIKSAIYNHRQKMTSVKLYLPVTTTFGTGTMTLTESKYKEQKKTNFA